MAHNYAEMSDAELDELARALKQEEVDTRERIRADKIAVRDEIQRRADITYAERKLNAVGITVTPETLKLVMEGH